MTMTLQQAAEAYGKAQAAYMNHYNPGNPGASFYAEELLLESAAQDAREAFFWVKHQLKNAAPQTENGKGVFKGYPNAAARAQRSAANAANSTDNFVEELRKKQQAVFDYQAPCAGDTQQPSYIVNLCQMNDQT